MPGTSESLSRLPSRKQSTNPGYTLCELDTVRICGVRVHAHAYACVSTLEARRHLDTSFWQIYTTKILCPRVFGLFGT